MCQTIRLDFSHKSSEGKKENFKCKFYTTFYHSFEGMKKQSDVHIERNLCPFFSLTGRVTGTGRGEVSFHLHSCDEHVFTSEGLFTQQLRSRGGGGVFTRVWDKAMALMGFR